MIRVNRILYTTTWVYFFNSWTKWIQDEQRKKRKWKCDYVLTIWIGDHWKLSKESSSHLVDYKKMWLKSHQNILLKLKLYFYKIKQPQKIAAVILINQLASVDQAVQDFKGVSLNVGIYPFRKLSSWISPFTFLDFFCYKALMFFYFLFFKLYIWVWMAVAFE